MMPSSIDSLEAESETNGAANLDTGVDASGERDIESGAVTKNRRGGPVANTNENALLKEEKESCLRILHSGFWGESSRS